MYAKYIVSRCPDLCLVCIKGFHRPSTLISWTGRPSVPVVVAALMQKLCDVSGEGTGRLRTGAEAERLDVYLSGGGILLMQ